jgi:glyoxylase-like metal-dependent hydrolase (beta-lactamase superfamily II)
MVIERAPLEDELGDVLDKAIQACACSEAEAATRTGISAERLRAIIDYCEQPSTDELDRLAEVLRLRPEGLRAVASEAYPLPEICGLPFCLYPLRMPHGIGVANAYLVADCGADWGILFDTGSGADGLWRSWPQRISRVAAVFLTHYETEHCGGLDGVRQRFPEVPVFGPAGENRPAGVVALENGGCVREGGFAVEVLSTPGHAAAHHAYRVTVPNAPHGCDLLVSGDLLFAGSIGGAYHCCQRLHQSLDAVLAATSETTVVAPGHGPLTTMGNERAFNPFL